MTIYDLLEKNQLIHGIEAEQAYIDSFVKELEQEIQRREKDWGDLVAKTVQESIFKALTTFFGKEQA